MDLGFETIGNATLICHDGGPLLVTDPWLFGSAYFGSWIHQHRIPAEQLAAAEACPYVWVSHGHPDHLSLDSLKRLSGAEILLPDHVGGRVLADLREAGFRVRVLPDGVWTPLSDRVRVLCIADVYQDAVLLVDLDGTLIVNSNDAADRGGGPRVAQCIAKARRSYLMALIGYGDADMNNVFDESGERIAPVGAQRDPLGPGIDALLERFGVDAYVPFSTLHRYQRTDSAWANSLITEPADFARGFPSGTGREILPAYARVDLIRDQVETIDPPPNRVELRSPESFGDNWSDPLTVQDVALAERYFRRFEHLPHCMGFIRLRVGGCEHHIDLHPVRPELREKGITFETPRGSLVTALKFEVFDDLMIGNFTRTTLHGAWSQPGTAGLYPDFNPFVTKYGDNGRARTAGELRAYFAEYRRRGFFGYGDDAAGRAELETLAPYLGLP